MMNTCYEKHGEIYTREFATGLQCAPGDLPSVVPYECIPRFSNNGQVWTQHTDVVLVHGS